MIDDTGKCSTATDPHFEAAFQEALISAQMDEVPVGAALCFDNYLIATAHNEKENLSNPLAHAEILVIQKACRYLESWRLHDCTLYVTKEPCFLCSFAIFEARIPKVVFGCSDKQDRGLCKLLTLNLAPYQIEIVPKLEEERCEKILSEFFHQLRRGVRVVEGARLESV